MRPWPHGALIVYLAALAVGVLTPLPPPMPLDPSTTPRPPDGLVADAIRNLVMLLPLGWLLASLGRGARFAAVLGFLLSLSIEGAQVLVPGRFPSAIDLVANTLSAAGGALFYASRRRWLAPDPKATGRIALALGLTAAVGMAAGIQLLRFSAGGPDFFAGWRPELGRYERYSGAIRGARIGSLELPIGRLTDSEDFVEALAGGMPLLLQAEPRSSREAIAPLFTIHDTDEDEILLVGAQGDDLLLLIHTRAIDFGLEQPAHRWAGALRAAAHESRSRPVDRAAPLEGDVARIESDGVPAANDTFEIRIERSASSARLSIEGRSLGERIWSPGRVWGLLIPGRVVTTGLESFLDALAIALLALPCAYYARRVGPVAIGFACLLVLLPRLGPVAGPQPAEWIGLVAGLAVARIARVVCPRIVGLTPNPMPRDSYDAEPS